MENKKKTYDELLEEIKDYMNNNQLTNDECLLMIASTDKATHSAVVGSEKELVATLAKQIVEDESLKDVLEKALKIAEVVTTLQKVAKDGNGDKLASLLGGKEDEK